MRRPSTSRCPAAASRWARVISSTPSPIEISEIFLGLGYTVAQGPEVETDYYNFDGAQCPGRSPQP